MYKVYGCGSNPQGLLGKRGTFNKFTLIDTLDKYRIIQISCGYQINFMLTDDNVILEIRNSNIKEHKIPNETVVSINTGTYHSFALTESGNVYAIRGNKIGQVCLNKCNLSTYTKLPFFEDKKVIKVLGSYENSYFLCENGDYYGSGMGKRLSETLVDKDINSPELLSSNVEEFYSGNEARGHFFIRENGDVMAFGENDFGQLGVGSSVNLKITTKLTVLPSAPINQICMGFYSSTLITKDGKLYGTGKLYNNGLHKKTEVFTHVTGLENEFITHLSSGQDQSLALTDSLKILAWGGNNSTGDQGHSGSAFKKPLEVTIPDLESKENVVLHCGLYCSYIYTVPKNSLISDLQNLRKTGLFSDCKIHGKPCHKELIKWRTGKTIHEVKKHLEEVYSEEQSNLFLEWVYTNNYSSNTNLIRISQELKFEDLKTIKINEVFKKIYSDEDSKDFKLLVAIDDEDDNEEEEEEEEFEEIPVHKLILIARSGLFREMFQNIKEESKSVKDFSGKSIESLEIFIKFLYTDKIELTADDDPQLVVEELSDAAEYYQLNKFSTLNRELKKISLQFKL
ncbi:hypothetical protein M0812_19310 [Anaeramoeba flamelloides]|uniref:BTB domain-containing protein n=1 Tax=Anaeramoeba flamelloides TaxID=1746091 RepID=A0AAV7Z558_9EUKA|nr:hypothetical protein M0812_19310 [Anaeramoeba flamelloides]